MSTKQTAEDGRTIVLWPPSTYRPEPRIRWWHPEECTVLTGRCTCEPRLVGLGGDSDEA
jgi:hypothetical protein